MTNPNIPTPTLGDLPLDQNYFGEDPIVKDHVDDILKASMLNTYEALKDIECPDFLRTYSGEYKVKPHVSKAHLEELKKMLTIITYNPDTEFRPGDQLRAAREVLLGVTHEYEKLCNILGKKIDFGNQENLQGKANEPFRNIYPQTFGEMPAIWRSEDPDIIKQQQKPLPIKQNGW